MITIDLKPLVKALAPMLATELRALLARRRESLDEAGSSPTSDPVTGLSEEDSPRRPDDMIDRHRAQEFGLTPRRFTYLAKKGAFPCFQLHARGCFAAYRRDVQAWLEQQKWKVPVSELPTEEPTTVPPLPPSPQELDQLILRTLESGRLRVIPGRGGNAETSARNPPKSRK